MPCLGVASGITFLGSVQWGAFRGETKQRFGNPVQRMEVLEKKDGIKWPAV
jgi:hypothetical protein